MTLYDYFKLLEPLAKSQVANMADGEPKSVLTFILTASEAVAGKPVDETTPQKLEDFATLALPHLKAVLPQEGAVGSLVGVAIDLGSFLFEALSKPATGTVKAPCDDSGMPVDQTKSGEA